MYHSSILFTGKKHSFNVTHNGLLSDFIGFESRDFCFLTKQVPVLKQIQIHV